jgi:hypothetical protein
LTHRHPAHPKALEKSGAFSFVSSNIVLWCTLKSGVDVRERSRSQFCGKEAVMISERIECGISNDLDADNR